MKRTLNYAGISERAEFQRSSDLLPHKRNVSFLAKRDKADIGPVTNVDVQLDRMPALNFGVSVNVKEEDCETGNHEDLSFNHPSNGVMSSSLVVMDDDDDFLVDGANAFPEKEMTGAKSEVESNDEIFSCLEESWLSSVCSKSEDSMSVSGLPSDLKDEKEVLPSSAFSCSSPLRSPNLPAPSSHSPVKFTSPHRFTDVKPFTPKNSTAAQNSGKRDPDSVFESTPRKRKKAMLARFDGNCVCCNLPIKQDVDEITYMTTSDRRVWIHVQCDDSHAS